MRISLNWLSDYVKLPTSTDALAHALTMAGLEIEGIEKRGEGLNGVVVAQIQESVQHPNADKLSVTQVDVGDGKLRQIVCGAKNFKVGDKVPLATPGTKLPNGVEIKVSALRGVESRGMLCSAKELGLVEEASGLLILDAGLKVGTPISETLKLNDTVFEVNVTPNRADALSHLGVAREVAVLTGATLSGPKTGVSEAPGLASDKVQIRIEAQDECRRYAARVLEGVKVGPSPMWLRARLEACGVRAINNVVDVTNYVMLEFGQPLHAFNLDKLAGQQIVVRKARPNEKIVTLDGKERVLSEEDLLVCDADKAQVLAGVMGGADSEVGETTERILLESAWFHPSTVRRSSKRHALHSESSHRFERGTDIGNVAQALDRAAALIAELTHATVLSGTVDVFPGKASAPSVSLRLSRLNDVLGVSLAQSEVKRILTTLGFSLKDEKDGILSFAIPGHRQDVTIEEDLIEEVARVHGYDNIAPRLPQGASALRAESARVLVERRMRQSLLAVGFDEVLNYSFVSEKELQALEAPIGVALKNPLSAEQSVMRTSMYAGLLQNVSRNVRHQVNSGRLYELGRTYTPDAEGGTNARPVCVEELKVAGVLWGKRTSRSWTTPEALVDFFDAKGAVESILASLHIQGARYSPLQGMPYHPRASAQVTLNGNRVGSLGEIHPKVARALDVPSGVFLFELAVGRLAEAAVLVPEFKALSKFPSVLRDLAVVVPDELACETVEGVILEVGKPLVKAATLFDVYKGKPIAEGRKNLAFALEYLSADRTLTDLEVQEAHGRIVEEVNRRLGGELRKA